MAPDHAARQSRTLIPAESGLIRLKEAIGIIG